MRFIIAVDTMFLAFFNRIARAFARFTGKSNFFLAKVMVCAMIASCAVLIMGYWMPLLDRQPSIFRTAFRGYIALVCLIYLNQCDKADGAIFSVNKIRVFNPEIYSPVRRTFCAILACIAAPAVLVEIFVRQNGVFLARVIAESFIVDLMAFVYFASLDPPQVGKSKIREWAEGFANSFRKLAPVSVKRK